MLTRNFFVPFKERIFCFLRKGRGSFYCRGNFFLAGLCYVSLKVRSRGGGEATLAGGVGVWGTQIGRLD
jgi:hypothetical protein